VLWIRTGSGFNRVPGSVPYPDLQSGDSQSGSGSKRAKIDQENRKQLINFIFCSAGYSLLRVEGFSCSLDVLYGGLGINKLQFLVKKRKENNFGCFLFFNFWSSQSWFHTRIRIYLKTLDPDPYIHKLKKREMPADSGRLC
jgi:hypothetical protein